jgi:hypothetical protein
MDFTWVTSDDANAIQNTIVDAKGDLISATGSDVPARLAVGANGETLVADSSTSTGLRYTRLFGANKNRIINGDFFINQRNFTSSTTNATYGFDRWVCNAVDGTTTVSAETFTLGTAPVAGYEGKNFVRIVSTGQTSAGALSGVTQRIESVRTLAGETATISFWAKAASGTPNVVVWVNQNFGTGGSPSTAVDTGTTKKAITTSWARYSFTVAIPSISGKTLGTAGDDRLAIIAVTSAGTDRAAYTDSIGIQSATIDIWGVQVEAGSVATPFQTATGTIQGELAACQRYYFRTYASTQPYNYFFAYSTTQLQGNWNLPVTMRAAVTSIDFANGQIQDISTGTTYQSASAPTLNTSTLDNVFLLWSGFTSIVAYRPYNVIGTGTLGYFGFSAEL